jgi:hypothetical protein
MDDSADSRLPVSDCHIECVDNKGRALGVVDRPANDLPREGSHPGAAVNFVFSRGTLRDVGNPQFVRSETVKLAVHQIIGGGDPMQPLHSRWAGKAAEATFTHQNSHQALAHLKFPTDRQLRMDSAGAVGSPGHNLDFVDQTGEPEAAHLSGRYRPVFVSVIAGRADTEKSAAQFGGSSQSRV